jgi:electron transport complex protein RnfD
MFLIPLAIVHSGIDIIFICFFCTLSCLFFDFCGHIIFQKQSKVDSSSILTGLIIAFLLPVVAPKYFCVVASAFAMLMVKHPFGGYGKNLFNPAAGGLAFLTVFSPKELLINPQSQNRNVLQSLKEWQAPDFDKFNMLTGNQPGPPCSVQILVLVGCFFYLSYNKVISQHIVWSFLTTCSFFALLFPRAGGLRFDSLSYELFAGTLIFAAIFMLTDPVTAPKLTFSKIIYGIIAGLLTMLIRYFSVLEEGVVFAIIIANSLSRKIDFTIKNIRRKNQRNEQNRTTSTFEK